MLLTEYNEAEHLRMTRLEGWEEGIREGIQKGGETERVANLKSLMGTTRWTAEKCLETLNVPSALWPRYLQILGGTQ